MTTDKTCAILTIFRVFSYLVCIDFALDVVDQGESMCSKYTQCKKYIVSAKVVKKVYVQIGK